MMPRKGFRHIGTVEEPYAFVTARQLIADFIALATALEGEAK
jgi:hypothetical protein